jgi:hypothetical protein
MTEDEVNAQVRQLQPHTQEATTDWSERTGADPYGRRLRDYRRYVKLPIFLDLPRLNSECGDEVTMTVSQHTLVCTMFSLTLAHSGVSSNSPSVLTSRSPCARSFERSTRRQTRLTTSLRQIYPCLMLSSMRLFVCTRQCPMTWAPVR